jgi:hypothetical protein
LRADIAKVLEIGTPLPDSDAKVVVERWSGEISAARALLADGSRGLPSYDVEASQQAFAKLRADVDAARAKVTPKKKFAFSRKRKPTAAAAEAAAAAAMSTMSAAESEAEAASVAAGAERDAAGAAAASAALLERLGAEEETIEGMSDAVVVVGPESGGGDDVRLVGLHRCVVLVTRPLSALRVDGLEECEVIAVPVAGSVLLHDCRGCSVHMAARQFRLHRSTDCAFFIHAMSRPIIEHCERLTFAPYLVSRGAGDAAAEEGAPRQRELLCEAGLLKDRSASSEADTAAVRNWQHVDDFGWIKATRSPNWTILPQTSWPKHLPDAASSQGFVCITDPLGWLPTDDPAHVAPAEADDTDAAAAESSDDDEL